MEFDKSATARFARGELDSAFADYSKAIESDPKYTPPFLNRGNLFKSRGDLAGAIRDYTAAIEIDPRCTAAYNNRGTARLGLGDLHGATADFEKAIRLDPRMAITYANRSGARTDLGDDSRSNDNGPLVHKPKDMEDAHQEENKT